MKAFLRETQEGTIIIDIEGESHAERVLLSHLSERHEAIICVGKYSEGPLKGFGMRFLVINKHDECKRRRR